MSEKSIFNRVGISLTVFMVIWVGLQLLLGKIIEKAAPGALENMEWLYWLVASGPMYLVAFPVILKMLKKLPRRQLFEHNLKAGHFMQLFFMAVALMFIGNIIGIIFTSIMTNVTGVEFAVSVTESILGYKLIWVFLISVVIAPIVEEILFRKVLIDRLIVFGDGVAIFLSAMLFGCMHGNFTQLFYAAFIGLIFGFVYVRTGKIKYSIGLHMLFNFCGGFVPAAFMKKMDPFALEDALMQGDFMALLDRIGALLGFAGFELALCGCGVAGFILLIVHRRKFRLNQGELQLTKGEVFKCMFTTPGMWLWLIATVALFVLNIVGV